MTELSQSDTWRHYIDLRDFPGDRMESLSSALNSIWATASGRELISDAFESNDSTRVVVQSGTLPHFTYSSGGLELPFAIEGSRTVNNPGAAEIAIVPDEQLFFCARHGSEEGGACPVDDQVELSDERLLRHELFHIAYEQSDLAQSMRTNLYAHIRDNGGLTEHDVLELQRVGFLSGSEAENYLNHVRSEQYLGLAELESQTGRQLSTEQLEQFTEHVVATDTEGLRDVLNDLPITATTVQHLASWNNGAITMEAAESLLARLDGGESLTFSDVEQTTGPLPYMQLSDLAQLGSLVGYLPEDTLQRLDQHQSGLSEMVQAWSDAQQNHEEVTVDNTDAALPGPDRGSYGNTISGPDGPAPWLKHIELSGPG